MATADFSRIATNIGALNALQSMRNINAKLGVHQERLATGKRINSAMDDPAGLTIATKLNARSEGLKTALDNIGDAKNLLSVAESGLSRVNDILVSMRSKSEQAASDTLGTSERDAVVTQLKAYAKQIDDIVDQTKWNGNKLIDGTYDATSLTFQTGADQGDTTTLNGLSDISASGGLGLASNVATTASASIANDTDNIIDEGTLLSGGNATLGDLSELTAGTYTISVNYGTDGTDATVQLLDADGNAQWIDSDGATTATETASQTMNIDLSSAAAVDFGDGLRAQVAAFPTGGGTFTATVAYEPASTEYQLNLVGSESGDNYLDGADSAANFASFMDTINSKLDTVSSQLADVGALAGRLTFKEDQVSVAQINVESSYNRIMNADMAYEQLEATKYSILQQTATTMLAQANMAPQGILSLFR